jgi:peptidoglycan/xylan/chitin deacetylase (PgdA/CDA1 family)
VAGGQRRGLLALTFDNLGEARELERGTWPHDAPVGRDRSVTEALPRLLDELEAHGLSATFFVEAINCELYPDAIRELVTRGHELGLHGWRHESWAGLPVQREREILRRAMDAFASLGVVVRGFRPPGGGVNPWSPGLLRELGIDWCSPEGGEFGVRDGLAYVPFEWELVDAYHLMQGFGELRGSRGDPLETLPVGELEARMLGAVEGLAGDGGRAGAAGGRRTLILHPFLMLDPGWWEAVRTVLARVAALSRGGDLWVAPGGAVAEMLCAEVSSR